MIKLPRAFYARPAPEVARDILGTILVRRVASTDLRGRIVETEAYTGQTDPGSHAFRGPTPRNRVMFGPAGRLYVYISYGMHNCMNVVTDEDGVAGAVLIRALEPLAGEAIMRRNRGREKLVDLCNGPGKLCQAFGITRAHNDCDLQSSGIWIEDEGWHPSEIAISTRVGLSAGGDLPLRFCVTGSPFVSRGGPSTKSPRPPPKEAVCQTRYSDT